MLERQVSMMRWFVFFVHSTEDSVDDTASTSSEATVGSACTAGCCEDPEVPNQPVDCAVLESTKEQIGNKNEFRCFNPKWYKEFSWVHLCTDRKKVFCYYCLSTSKRVLSK